MKKRIVLLGPPASGKGTQAEMIKKRYGIPSVSPGAMLRDEMRRGTALGIEADRLTRDGSMVPDDIVISLVRPWVKEHSGGFVFDGFPRNTAQAEALEEILSEQGETLDVVFYLDVPEELVRRRAMSRLTCIQCGRTYDSAVNTEKGCLACGGALVRRSDDTLEAFQQRMAQYLEKTKSLVDFYRCKGLLQTLEAAETPETVFNKIVSILEAPEA